MQIEEIERFLAKPTTTTTSYIKISFRSRASFYGLFIKDNDFTYLKGKNFWRIVPQSKLSDFSQSKDMNLAKIFNGSEFTRLSLYTEGFE